MNAIASRRTDRSIGTSNSDGLPRTAGQLVEAAILQVGSDAAAESAFHLLAHDPHEVLLPTTAATSIPWRAAVPLIRGRERGAM